MSAHARARCAAALLAAAAASFGAGAAAAAAPPAAGMPTVEDLVRVTDMSGLAASPDGRMIAFRTERASLDRDTYVLAWHVVPVDGGPARQIGGGGAPIYVDPGLVQGEQAFWSPDGRSIFYRALVDGAIGIWRAAADGGGAVPVVVGDADVEQLEMAPDGNGLLYRLGPSRDAIRRAERREYDDGILVDASVDLAQPLFRGGAVKGRMASQRLTGRWFERAGLLWRAPRRHYRLDLASLVVEDLGAAPSAGKSPVLVPVSHVAARSANGDLATATWDGKAGSVSVRAGTGLERRCAAPACRRHVTWLAWRPGTTQLLFATSDAHLSSDLFLWNIGTGAVRAVAAGTGLLSGARAPDRPCAVTHRAAVCVSAGAVAPPRLERIDLDTGARTVLFDPNPALRARRQPEVERLTWPLPDGRMATGLLLLPPAAAAHHLPLFISYYHCGGYLRGGEGDEWPFAPLVSTGFAVACINTVPEPDSTDQVAAYQTGLAAVRALVDRLDRRGLIDRSRIGMGGFSFGSEVTMWVAMHSDLLGAASIASTQLEPTYYWFNAVAGRDQPEILRQVWGLGPPDDTEAAWRDIAPALNTERLHAPLLMQLPEQEARLVVELHARLSRSRTPVELYAFPDEDHIKVQPRHKAAAYQRNLDWFRFWLLGRRTDDPASAARFERWQKLRERSRQPGSPSD